MLKAMDVVMMALLGTFVFAEEPDKDCRIIRYEDFGALGDGQTDDIAAIAKAHAFANQHGLPVRANDEATYYISGQHKPVTIQTDTDFGTAQFVIDDRNVENRHAYIFEVRSAQQPLKQEELTTLRAGQKTIHDPKLKNCVVCVTDSNTRRYIRKGLNQDNGSPQNDVFLVDENGNVDANTPILWDFNQITDLAAYPIDPTPLKISGGRFTTIANAAESKYTYYARGIEIRRSNVTVDGLEHRITGEGDHGAPYRGFINIVDCANVTVRNTIFTGHKTYQTIGSAGKPVSMGSYDFSIKRALNISFINCRQFNDIKDRTYWGIMGSNYCKNLLYDGCTFSRFDAHMGVANATIRNSTLGHMGINAIGQGRLTVENTTGYGWAFINLRSDYGSTWQGEFILRNCTFVPSGKDRISVSLIEGRNDEMHDFGYTCHMPERIIIDGLHIDDSRLPKDYVGPALFADFDPHGNPADKKKYPYIKTREVILKNITTASGKPLSICENPNRFNDVLVKRN
jgi:hypothetical protein